MNDAIYKPAVDTKESFAAEKEETYEAGAEKNPKSAFEPHPCPICREKFQNPVTGEMRYGPETMAAIEEGRAMLRGDIPTKWYDNVDDFFADLKKDDDDDEDDE